MLYYAFIISRGNDAVQAYKATVLLSYTLVTQRLGVLGLVIALLGISIFGMLFYSLKLLIQTCRRSRFLQTSIESLEEMPTSWNTDVESGCGGCSQFRQEVAAEPSRPMTNSHHGSASGRRHNLRQINESNEPWTVQEASVSMSRGKGTAIKDHGKD